jgi:hypothetical protein
VCFINGFYIYQAHFNISLSLSLHHVLRVLHAWRMQIWRAQSVVWLSCGLDDEGTELWLLAAAVIFLPPQNIQTASGADPSSCLVYTRVSFPRDKVARENSWQLTSISAKVTNVGSCLSTVQSIFMVWYLIQDRDKFAIFDLFKLISILIFYHLKFSHCSFEKYLLYSLRFGD